MEVAFPTELRIESDPRVSETMSGLLVSVVAKAREMRFFETLTDGLALKMKAVVYSQQNKIETIAVSVAVGCRHIAEIQSRLVPDHAAAQLFGMERFPDQAQINHFLRACGPTQVTHLAEAHTRLLLANSRADDRTAWWTAPNGQRLLVVDLDQTSIVTRGTTATGATRGHFGRKRGQLGYKKSVAVLGGAVQEILWQRLGPGNEHGQDAVPAALAALQRLAAAKGIGPGEVLWRADSQYGSTGVIRQLQAAGQHYLLKGYTPRTAQALAAALPATTVWTNAGSDSYGSQVWVTDAGEQALAGHDDPPDLPPVHTRVVLLVRVRWTERRKRGKGAPETVREKEVSYEHYVTDLPVAALTPEQVIAAYNGRESEEGFFQTEQDTFGAAYLRTRHKDGEEAFLWLMASTINLLRWVQHSTFAQTPIEDLGLHHLVTKVIRIPATIVRMAHAWLVRLPDLAWVTRQLAHARLTTVAIQYPLPMLFGGYSP
jgi:Transposase DDE domain group 1